MLSETSRVGNCVHARTIMALPQPTMQDAIQDVSATPWELGPASALPGIGEAIRMLSFALGLAH